MFCCVECDSKGFINFKTDLSCFYFEHHYQNGFVLLEIFAYPSNKRITYGPELNL